MSEQISIYLSSNRTNKDLTREELVIFIKECKEKDEFYALFISFREELTNRITNK